MIDINLIRENKEKVIENLKKKFQEHKIPSIDVVLDLDREKREKKQKGDALRSLKNSKSAEIGVLVRDGK